MKARQIAVLGAVILFACVVANFATAWHASTLLFAVLIAVVATASGYFGFSIYSRAIGSSAASVVLTFVATGLVIALTCTLTGGLLMHVGLIIAALLTPVGGAVVAIDADGWWRNGN